MMQKVVMSALAAPLTFAVAFAANGSSPSKAEIRTEHLVVTVSDEGPSLSVTDRRTGRQWATREDGETSVSEIVRTPSAIGFKLRHGKSNVRYGVLVTPLPQLPEVLVTVSGEGVMNDSLQYPGGFGTKRGDRLILPMNEGISFPVEQETDYPKRLVTYGGHGLCMSFAGVQDDATGAGYMALVETSDDAAVTIGRTAKEPTLALGLSWEPQRGRFGPARAMRFVFFDRGGHVAMCKRYRRHAKERGLLKTFAEKIRERPNVDRLLGAANIWCWEADRIGTVKRLREAGIDRLIWSMGGDAREVKEIAEMDGVLVSRYDVYHDIYHPEQLAKLGWETGANADAWPDGVVWNSADSNDWRRAWGVQAKDGTWTYCACMCDAVTARFCRRNVLEELQEKPYNTRFVDVTTAAPWDTCENPAHPMTRGDSRRFRIGLLRLLCDEFGLVVGSETGHDAAVPYCDYFEGMMSLCDYRVPDSGRNMGQVWTNVPPLVAKYQVGPEYRLPLWELVYHDCVCAHWYWGDYSNKLTPIWDRRDLFNALYGTMGMYLFSAGQWEREHDRFVKSYRLISPIARKTGKSEMLDHEILSADRLVQRSTFADGTVVTVNFGTTPFALPGGVSIDAGGVMVR